MKSVISVFTIIGFISVAVFGFAAMNHNSNHSHGGCVAAATQGTDCPKGSDVTAFLNFHFYAFRSFSLATIGENVMSALSLVIFTSLLFIGLAFLSFFLFRPPKLVFYRYQFQNSFLPPQKQKLTRWLARHENSPNIL